MRTHLSYLIILLSAAFISCNGNIDSTKIPTAKTIAEIVSEQMQGAWKNPALKDSFQFYEVMKTFYTDNNNQPVWSSSETIKPIADTFVLYLQHAGRDGLFRQDYDYQKIKILYDSLKQDSVFRTSPQNWVKNELLMTAAFFHVLQDLSQGRMVPDSMRLVQNRSAWKKQFFLPLLSLLENNNLQQVLAAAQPKHTAYWQLKEGIAAFVDSMDTKNYTVVPFPYTDTAKFLKIVQKRFKESRLSFPDVALEDSAQLAQTIIRFQKSAKLTPDGIPGRAVVSRLNQTDKVKFLRFAVTMDRYKGLPETMPEHYIWVNIPAYYLTLWQADTVVLSSKIICGKPNTRTPMLTSKISDMIIYPTWTVPNSIIKKEMIPGLQRNPGYLARRDMYLVNNKGERVDPYTIQWSKYSKGLPFMVRQASGDNNALGVMKFNFNNAYSVYLHDTNQRYLFKNSMRALSHGCVRVEAWKELADFIADNDSMSNKQAVTLDYNKDSINNWLLARKMHKIEVKKQIPLFISYFGCDFAKGQVVFYDDIYNDDMEMIAKYMSRKDFSL